MPTINEQGSDAKLCLDCKESLNGFIGLIPEKGEVCIKCYLKNLISNETS